MIHIATYCIISLGRYQTQLFVPEAPFCIGTFYVNLKENKIFYFLPAFHLVGQNFCIFFTCRCTSFCDNCLRSLLCRRTGDKAVWGNVSTGACNLTWQKTKWSFATCYLCTSRHFQITSDSVRGLLLGKSGLVCTMMTNWAGDMMSMKIHGSNFLLTQSNAKPVFVSPMPQKNLNQSKTLPKETKLNQLLFPSLNCSIILQKYL